MPVNGNLLCVRADPRFVGVRVSLFSKGDVRVFVSLACPASPRASLDIRVSGCLPVVCLSVYMSVCLYIPLSLSLPVSVSVSVSLCLCGGWCVCAKAYIPDCTWGGCGAGCM